MNSNANQIDYLADGFMSLKEARLTLPAKHRPAYEQLWRWAAGIPLRDGTMLVLRSIRRGPNRMYTRREWLNQFFADYDEATKAGKLDRRQNKRIRRSRIKRTGR